MLSYTLELCIFAIDEVPDIEIYFEWPTHCQGWRLKPWAEFERQLAARDRYWGKARKLPIQLGRPGYLLTLEEALVLLEYR